MKTRAVISQVAQPRELPHSLRTSGSQRVLHSLEQDGFYTPIWPPLKQSTRTRKSTKPPEEIKDELPTLGEEELLHDLLKRMNTPPLANGEAKVVLAISDVMLRSTWEKKLILSGVPEDLIVVITDPNDFDPKDSSIAIVLFDTYDTSSLTLCSKVKRTKRKDVVCTLIGDHETVYKYNPHKVTVAHINEHETPTQICRILHEELMDLMATRFSTTAPVHIKDQFFPSRVRGQYENTNS